MQPTYLSWSGYFDLIDQCDVFVLLDSVQFEKRSWQQRNRVKGPQGEIWLTVPVLSKGRPEQRIFEVEIDRSRNFETKHLKTIHHCYGKARFYERYIGNLTAILSKGHHHLVELNIELIQWFRRELGIVREPLRSSSLDVSGKRVDLLLTICKTVGADRYVSPPGSRVYLDQNNMFAMNGIELVYQDYAPPPYTQLHGEFLPSLSVLDLLLNEGDGSLSVIRSGRRTPALPE